MASITRDGNGEGEAMGCSHFGGKEGKQVRRLHGVGGERHSEAWHSGWGG
jgi:hypothetical protein